MSIEPMYRNCLKATEQINKKSFPELDQNFISFTKDMKTYILGRENLNTCRKYTQASIISSRSGKIDNKHIKKYLDILVKKDKDMNRKSDSLDTLLKDIKKRYIASKKKLIQRNHQHLLDIKSGKIPSEELIQMLVKLGNDINKLSYDGIQSYKSEINVFVKKIEKDIVDDTFTAYNKIIKLDAETFGRMKEKLWSNTDYAGFIRIGAFESGQEYNKGLN
jgi:hypothetical protein